MKTFEYTCRDGGGRAVRGAVEAADRAAAVRALSARGLAAVSLSERAAPRRGRPLAALRWALPCATAALA
ncbi:MAG: type II secretion system F family protein, partial [Kiritimatiellaeota bacterium]|nr:type II secretion system F family protein [Kiritimatiellota bacterium]